MTCTYFIRAGKDGPIKIGISSNPERRARELAKQAPDEMRVIATLPKGRLLELRLHRALHASSRRLEWFNPTPDVRSVVALALVHGIEAVQLWLQAKEAVPVEIRPIAYEPTTDFDVDIRHLIGKAFRDAVGRHGMATVCAAVGRSRDVVEKIILRSRYDVPVSVFLALEMLDPGACVPVYARCGSVPRNIIDLADEPAKEAIDAQLARLSPRDVA